MKKREINKQKQKLKKTKDFKLLRYAKNMCVLLVVMFLMYTMILSTTTVGGIAVLINENLFVCVGFIVCTANLYLWNEMKIMIVDLNNYSNIESIRIKLVLIAIVQVIMFNYASAALVIISLVKYFKWSDIKIRKINIEIKNTHQRLSVGVFTLILVSFTSLSYFITYTALIL